MQNLTLQSNQRPASVTLEIERLTLLYRQNIPGLLGLLMYGLSYAYVCHDVMSPTMLAAWVSVVVISCAARALASLLWMKKGPLVQTIEATRPWLRFLNAMLFISGAAWGVAGWMMRYSHTPSQQIFVSLTVVFMVAGAIVCWSISKYAMFLVVLPAFIPWAVGQIYSDDPMTIFMGFLSLIYLILGSRVGISLNRYVENSLKLNIENIELNRKLQNDILNKARAEESMRLAVVHEAANQAKSMFLANASHEIRTPLAAISGYVEALMNQLQNPAGHEPQMRSDLIAIDRNTKHLISLVNDFLDLSKLETGRIYLQKSAMHLRNEIEEALQMLRSPLESKNLKLNLILEPTLPVLIYSDPLRFRQILVNLISNAIKFTAQGTIEIKVSHRQLETTDGKLIVQITDTGLGMDENTVAHLFEPFIRGRSEEVQRVSGSGLGLTLSRNLARLLGGELSLLHSKPGIGSEFELTLNTGPQQNLKLTAAVRTPQTSCRLSPASILVVDDDQDLRELMQRFLERHGAKVDVAQNGRIAVDMALQKTYGVVLMDMKMPLLDGYEATHELRRRGYVKPIIALTAYANTEDKEKSLLAGCDNYLAKPVNFEFMLETIASYPL